MAKKMAFFPSFDSLYPPVSTHTYSLEFAKKYIYRKNILDIGCWSGPFEYLLVKKNIPCTVTGIDQDTNALQVAKRNFPQFVFLRADIHKPFPVKKKYDAAVLWMTIEHVKDEKKVLLNINRALKKNGVLCLSTMNRSILSIFFDFPSFLLGHRHYDPEALRRMLEETGFETLELKVVGRFAIAVRISIILFFKHFLKKEEPKWKFLYDKQMKDYKSTKGFNEIFISAKKVKEI